MGRSPCCSKVGLHRGPWSQREDALLVSYIEAHGEGQWRSLPKKAGLLRCGKSCRLRWMNYLRPDIKRGNITPDEEDIIMRLHSLLGNRWSLIAGRLPGRTDNEIKNYWNTHLIKRVENKGGTDEINTKRKNSKRVHYATKKKKRESGIVESERIKVHLPKAIKVTRLSLPRINSFESNITNSASIGSTVDGQPYGCGLLTDDDHDQGGGLMIDGNDNVSPIISQQSAILEEMYEEYLQLIQDDAMSHDDKSNNDKCYLDDMVQEVEAELDVLAETLLV